MISFGGVMLCAAIELTNVTALELKARTFFDVNNVRVGDPMVLTVDFIGNGDFASLHPPALSKYVNPADWKIDDASARTETYTDARRLIYRVRPMREGVLIFPSLEYSFKGWSAEMETVRANAVPVHVKKGAQVAVEEIVDVTTAAAEPPRIVTDPGVELSDDDAFAWEKAVADPSAAAFGEFAFPAGRMNEATMAIREGNYARALKIYSALEWRVGQTPEIERGIIAALAVKNQSETADLPMWRQVGRPLLKYAWPMRLALTLGAVLVVALVFYLIGRLIRALAAVALVFLATSVLSAHAENPFEAMDRLLKQSEQQMQQTMSMMSSLSVNGQQITGPKLTAVIYSPTNVIQAGTYYDLTVAMEVPNTWALESVTFFACSPDKPAELGKLQQLSNGVSVNPSNVVYRFQVPVMYDTELLDHQLQFRMEGQISTKVTRGNMQFVSSQSYSVESAPLQLKVLGLPTEGRPDDFSGLISSGLRLTVHPDTLRVETNDVIKLVYRLSTHGRVPYRYLPEGTAYEIRRDERHSGDINAEYMRYFVANGASHTPRVEFSYYNTTKHQYERVVVEGYKITYVPVADNP